MNRPRSIPRAPVRRWHATALLLAAMPAFAQSTPAPKSSELFARVTYDESKVARAFETSIARYVPADGKPDGLVVDLVSAVHVGDAPYYHKLNEEFKKYDVVLYEYVAPTGVIPKKGDEPRSIVSKVQHLTKNVLELSFQLDEVDYSAPNFIHADMTPEQFAKSMEQRGESFGSMFLQIMLQSYAREMSRAGENQDLQILIALFRNDRSLVLKRILSEQFQDMEALNSALNGPDGSTLLTERNKVALETLRKQIDKGARRIAIFYGCGHMPDMDQRLLADFGLKRGSIRWFVAWDMSGKPAAAKK